MPQTLLAALWLPALSEVEDKSSLCAGPEGTLISLRLREQISPGFLWLCQSSCYSGIYLRSHCHTRHLGDGAFTCVVVQPCGKKTPSFKSLVDHIPFKPLLLVVTYTSGTWAMRLTPDKRSLSLPIFSRDQRHLQHKAALQQLLPKLTFHFFATAHFYCHHFHASN